MRDPIQEGQYYSLSYIKTNLIDEEKSFFEVFDLERDSTKTAQSAGVYNIGQSDTSCVFRVVIKNKEYLFIHKEYSSDQTAVEIIPAPGTGKRIVIVYGSVRTASSTGEAYIHDTDWEAFKVYASNFSTLQAGNVIIKAKENTPVKYTSTTGSKDQFIALNYYIEAV